jgi:hypothetical protein
MLTLIEDVHPFYESDQFATLLLMLTEDLFMRIERQPPSRPVRLYKTNTQYTLDAVEKMKSLLDRLYPPGEETSYRMVHPVKMRLEALRELMES